MPLHAIAGLPRSGSTLLCNLLNQRPDTYASSTSALAQAIVGLSGVFTQAPEELSRLANIPGSEKHHVALMRQLAESWHDVDHPVVFDKGRGWLQGGHAPLLRRVLPESTIVITVRDPRDVLASVERQHQLTGQYGPHGNLWDRASQQMAEDGLIGSCIAGVEDVIRRQLDPVYFLVYENFVAMPNVAMAQIERACGLEPHDYDFENVQPSSTDLDAAYRGKFPHDGSGPVRPANRKWSEVIPREIGDAAKDRWPLFFNAFGYA